MSESAPAKVGKYQIDVTIGRGAMGVVYRGYDVDLDRVVAVKTVHAHLMEDEERASYLDRFGQEARAAARCLHGNLVTVFDYLVQDEAPYLVMEYVEAQTLGDRMRASPPLSLAGSAAVVRQLLDGLGAVHAAGITHRDIKPANLLFLADGRVKLTDFGVARVESLAATQAGMVGTPYYMSPEQFRGHRADLRSDLYAVGVLFFELLAGRKPFAATDLAGLANEVMGAERPAVSAHAPGLEALDPVIARALALEPGDRFQSASAFSQAIRKALGEAAEREVPEADRTVFVPRAAPRPSPATGAGASQSSLGGSLADHLSKSALERIERELADSLGPIAKVMVRRAAAKTADIGAMVEELASRIADAKKAEAFRQSAMRLAMDGTMIGAALSDATLDELARKLSPYVGPIAKVMVKRNAAKVRNYEELCETLARGIPDERERRAFLASMR